MSESPSDRFRELPAEQMLIVNQLCNRLEAAWRAGSPLCCEELLRELPLAARDAALVELLPLELEWRQRTKMPLERTELQARFPEVAATHWDVWLAEVASMAAAPPPPLASVSLPKKMGDYQLLGALGAGGMGTVFKARHERMGRIVALKVMRPDLQRDRSLLQRFEREVRAAARLTHPNIVAAFDAREEDGQLFLITEFVDGLDLEAYVRQHGPLPMEQAIDCVRQAACGLDYAHRQGVVHRDIKPANLLLDRNGVCKILDVGLARLDVPDGTEHAGMSSGGMVLGTAAYMAPEQARDPATVDARADLYSLGCTLFFLLNGAPPFGGSTALERLVAHAQQPLPPLFANGSDQRQTAATLEKIFQRLLAKDPSQRFQTASELVAALTGIALSPANERSSLVRRKWLAMAGGAAIVGLALRAYFVSQTSKNPPVTNDHGLLFDGKTSFVHVPDLVPTADENYTIELLIEPRELRLSNAVSWMGPDWMAIFLSSDFHWGVARRFHGEPHLIVSSMPATPNRTVHLAAEFVGSSLRLFLDGRLVETQSIEYPLSETTGGLFMGGVPAGRLPSEQADRFFDGAIHAVRISRGAIHRDSFTVPAQLVATAETVALFSFEEGVGRRTISSDEQRWTGEIHSAEWQRTRR